MRAITVKNKLLSIDWYVFLYTLLVSIISIRYISLMTHSFDGVPQEVFNIARIFLAATAFLRFALKANTHKSYIKVLLPLLVGAGIAVFICTDYIFLLDLAFVLMASLEIKPWKITFGFGCTFFTALLGAFALAKKGYIRNYWFNGFDALGFTRKSFALAVIGVITVSFLLTIVYYVVKRKNLLKNEFIYLALIGLICVGTVFVSILRLDRTRAISDGAYTIYSEDSGIGIEMHMHGIESYDLSFDRHEAQSFDIKWEGQYYGIYADTDGVTRSLCVIDGQLKLGDYEESKNAHCWVIASVPGTPYFWIQNAETGYYICISNEGKLRLEMGINGQIDDRYLLRLGDENLEYYDSNIVDDVTKIDISNCNVSLNEEFEYTGEALIPAISVDINGTILEEGRDYEVEITDNYYPGLATVYIRAIGDYCGEIVKHFSITIENTMSQYSNSNKVSDYIFRAFRLGYNRLPTPEEFYSFKKYICLTMQTPDTLFWMLLSNGAFSNSNYELIEGAYRLMLQRNGTRSEYDLWVNALDSGIPRQNIIGEIVDSPDYQSIWPNFNLNFQ